MRDSFDAVPRRSTVRPDRIVFEAPLLPPDEVNWLDGGGPKLMTELDVLRRRLLRAARQGSAGRVSHLIEHGGFERDEAAERVLIEAYKIARERGDEAVMEVVAGELDGSFAELMDSANTVRCPFCMTRSALHLEEKCEHFLGIRFDSFWDGYDDAPFEGLRALMQSLPDEIGEDEIVAASPAEVRDCLAAAVGGNDDFWRPEPDVETERLEWGGMASGAAEHYFHADPGPVLAATYDRIARAEQFAREYIDRHRGRRVA